MPRPFALPAPRSSFTGFRFPPEVILLAVRWYLRYSLPYRDVEDLLASPRTNLLCTRRTQR
jgi:transposase, IS6 family